MKILVLGGGISGLSAAWRLGRLLPQAEILLIEKQNRLGGWIETKRVERFIFEKGPRTFSAPRSPSLLNLIVEVGLEPHLLFSSPSANTRYLWRRGCLKSIGSLLWPHAWRLFSEPWIARGKEEETIHSFACRRFGPKIAELFFDPLTLGVFAGDSRTLSLQASFPSLARMEQENGSLVLSLLRKKRKKTFPGSLFTLQGGMQTLIDALSSSLRAEVLFNTPVTALVREEKEWRVETAKGAFTADAVFVALPAPVLGALLPGMPKIACASLTVVNMGFSHLSLPKKGYGYLVPSSEGKELLGMIFDAELFPRSGPALTAMVRGAAKNPERVALEALSAHLRVSASPHRIELCRAEQAIPQLGVGQRVALSQWEKSLKGLYLLGNVWEGPSVEACISRSERMVQHFFSKEDESLDGADPQSCSPAL